jgi:hypothetical protein
MKFGVYLLNFIIMHIFLFKLPILIYKKNHIDDFTIHLWHVNRVHFAKSPLWCKELSNLSCNYPPRKREAKTLWECDNNYVKSSNIIWRWNNSRCKHNKIYNKFAFPKFNANRLKISTKSIITLLYIEHFYMDDEKQDRSSILCINFQILHGKNRLKVGISQYK